MDQGINRTINNYLEHLIKSNIQFNKVYLFGSYAKNIQTDESDIDLALIINDEKNKIDFFNLQVELLVLASDIDTRIEPHPISLDDFNINNPLAKEILNYGKEIKYN